MTVVLLCRAIINSFISIRSGGQARSKCTQNTTRKPEASRVECVPNNLKESDGRRNLTAFVRTFGWWSSLSDHRVPISHVPPSMAEVVFGPLHERNVGNLKTLNSVIFPVKYSEDFYTNLLKAPEFTALGARRCAAAARAPVDARRRLCAAYYKDIFVGAVCCRLEGAADAPTKRLYIMTLGVLAPYRCRGIGACTREGATVPAPQTHPMGSFTDRVWRWCMRAGAQLVERVLRLAAAHEGHVISEVVLHVQSNNEEAMRFYERFGFTRGELVPAYYKHITPPDAYVLRKVLRA
jgi:ribosomal protein S18 acetylase RimI-like enzyme